MTLIDLSYADPPTPGELAPRARAQGRRLRRRRQATTSALPIGLVVGLAVGTTQLLHVGTAAPITPSGGSSTTSTRLATTQAPPTNDDIPMVPAGPVVDLGLHTSDGDLVVYATQSGYQCLSERNASGLQPTECRKLIELDVDGLWGNSAFAPLAHPVVLPTPKGEPARWLVFGLARGRVDHVMISLPSGKVAATLAPIGDPTVGRFYWTVTDDFDDLGHFLDPHLAAAYPAAIGDIPRVGYAGAQVIQSCVGNVCT